ncbi:UPF0175 family protein [Candidatus Woesearchaeota archaeon]|nr:UPF0175 family protein [Candidatus Woesearchaeota archaeon]
MYDDEIEAVIDAGYYSNKSEVVRDALRSLFEGNTHLRLAAAVEMYKKGEVTLSKAAEIACMNFEEFKDVLVDRKIRIKVSPQSKEEINRGATLLRIRRRSG